MPAFPTRRALVATALVAAAATGGPALARADGPSVLFGSGVSGVGTRFNFSVSNPPLGGHATFAANPGQHYARRDGDVTCFRRVGNAAVFGIDVSLPDAPRFLEFYIADNGTTGDRLGGIGRAWTAAPPANCRYKVPSGIRGRVLASGDIGFSAPADPNAPVDNSGLDGTVEGSPPQTTPTTTTTTTTTTPATATTPVAASTTTTGAPASTAPAPTSQAPSSSAASTSEPGSSAAAGSGSVSGSTIVTAARPLAVSSPKICASRRTIAIHIKRQKAVRYSRVTVTVNGKRVKTIRPTTAHPLATTISLKGLPRSAVTVTVRATRTTGGVVRRTQRFLTCTRKRTAV